MGEPNRQASLTLLAQLLTGVPHTGGPDDVTFSLDEIEQVDDKLSTKVVVGSGDVYRVSVEWLRDESP